jgi:hypothetical protein
MTFEEAGRAVDREVQKLVEFVDQKVRPSTRREMAELLKKASENLAKMAAGLESRPDSGQPEKKP